MDKILGIVRHVLTFGGGYVVAQGHITAADLEMIVGALVTIAGGLWSVFDKTSK